MSESAPKVPPLLLEVVGLEGERGTGWFKRGELPWLLGEAGRVLIVEDIAEVVLGSRRYARGWVQREMDSGN